MPEITRRHKEIELMFDSEERGVLFGLLEELETMLGGDLERSDPVVQRLLPRAYQDPDEQAAYQDLTETSLVAGKLDAISSLRNSMEPFDDGNSYVVLREEARGPFLALMTDLRLALGARLGVDAGMMSAEHDPRDPSAAALMILDWLGWIQGSILQEMGY